MANNFFLFCCLLVQHVFASRMSMHYNSALACAGNARSKLFLSVIVTTTNSAPSDQIDRLVLQIRNLQNNLNQQNMILSVEQIIVEYNYDDSKPSLYKMLEARGVFAPEAPGGGGGGAPPHLVRIIRVSADDHAKIVAKMGLDYEVNFLEFYAKNIGIRRACGQFVLPTNSDVIFAPEFYLFLKRDGLRNDTYYRMPRCNTNANSDAMLNAPLDTHVAHLKRGLVDCWWCQNVGSSWAKYVNRPFSKFAEPVKWTECIQAPGDFLILPKTVFFLFRGYPDLALPIVLDDFPVWQAVAAGLALGIVPEPAVAFHVNHGKGYLSDGRWANTAEMQRVYKLQEIGRQMMQARKLEVLNDASWGLAGIFLQEDVY